MQKLLIQLSVVRCITIQYSELYSVQCSAVNYNAVQRGGRKAERQDRREWFPEVLVWKDRPGEGQDTTYRRTEQCYRDTKLLTCGMTFT